MELAQTRLYEKLIHHSIKTIQFTKNHHLKRYLVTIYFHLLRPAPSGGGAAIDMYTYNDL